MNSAQKIMQLLKQIGFKCIGTGTKGITVYFEPIIINQRSYSGVRFTTQFCTVLHPMDPWGLTETSFTYTEFIWKFGIVQREVIYEIQENIKVIRADAMKAATGLVNSLYGYHSKL